MAILPSFLLLLFADGLRRGRRFAWAGALLIQASLSLLAAVTIAGVLLPPPGSAAREGVGGIELSGYSHPLSLVLPMLVPVLLTVLLLAGRNLFPVQAPRGTYLRLARRVVIALIVLSLAHVGLGLVLADGFTPVPGPPQLLADVPDRFLPLGFLVDRSPAFFPESTAAVVLYGAPASYSGRGPEHYCSGRSCVRPTAGTARTRSGPGTSSSRTAAARSPG